MGLFQLTKTSQYSSLVIFNRVLNSRFEKIPLFQTRREKYNIFIMGKKFTICPSKHSETILPATKHLSLAKYS